MELNRYLTLLKFDPCPGGTVMDTNTIIIILLILLLIGGGGWYGRGRWY